MNDYTPIDCSLHDELQLRVMRRRTCDIEWRDDAGTLHREQATLTDVFARSGVEYLKLDDGSELRLDHLVRVDGVVFEGTEC